MNLSPQILDEIKTCNMSQEVLIQFLARSKQKLEISALAEGNLMNPTLCGL
eukprot:TRINITY_DN798_c1_g1_i2.p1 TRINITY_DN798_c1_g1~~TRINITY_DN798_c1_g1_i2.p1  ORF type:complete len:51 (+),score=5.32 TRINITY_DN798_c1_g1_i2:340-492(+)